jgi:hypothetical protein
MIFPTPAAQLIGMDIVLAGHLRDGQALIGQQLLDDLCLVGLSKPATRLVPI